MIFVENSLSDPASNKILWYHGTMARSKVEFILTFSTWR